MSEKSAEGPYQLFILALSLFALIGLTVETFVRLDPPTRSILESADLAVCCLFLVDFVVSLLGARSKRRYFFSWGWIDLLSSIPALPALRIGRLARVFRILRVLRGLRATRIIASFLLNRRAQGAFLAAVLLSLLLVVFGSISVLQFETGDQSNIRTANDALWWAVVTLTTVGYGDHYPVTTGGRVVAVFLMTAGVGIFGVVAGFVASWFLQPVEARTDTDLEALTEEVRRLRQSLEERK